MNVVRRSLGVALICAVLLVVALMVNQINGPSIALDLFADALIVMGLGALLVTGVALFRHR